MRPLRLRPALLALAAGLACSDSTGPTVNGPSFFHVALDGHPWTPDTVTGYFFYTHPDSGTLNLFATRTRDSVTEDLTLSIRLPLPGRSLILADTGTVAVGYYSLTDETIPPPQVRSLLFTSTTSTPGTLGVSGFQPRDSVIAGTFSFTASAMPDTAGHRTVAGSFRIHYLTEQVFFPVHPVRRELPPGHRLMMTPQASGRGPG